MVKILIKPANNGYTVQTGTGKRLRIIANVRTLEQAIGCKILMRKEGKG